LAPPDHGVLHRLIAQSKLFQIAIGCRPNGEPSMISCPNVSKEQIRLHYDLGTLLYRLLWGRHIHHGLFSNIDGQAPERPSVAQLRLTETLAREAAIRPGDHVLDVGCGMGGSSIHLAKQLGCQVIGITLSGFQCRWATCAAWWHGVTRHTRFRSGDADQIELEAAAFDVLWSIEATEHFFDKAEFFRRAHAWLRPGGRVAICAWLAGDTVTSEEARRTIHEVCEGFFCPSLGSNNDYQSWLRDAGFEVDVYYDWTDRVARTWEICARRVRRTGVRWVAPLLDRSAGKFLRRFETILHAYGSGAMRYGCFIAHKPGSKPA
jgi:tocopherol O-methyltransferase